MLNLTQRHSASASTQLRTLPGATRVSKVEGKGGNFIDLPPPRVTIKLYLTQGDVEHQLQEWLREGETKRRTNTQEAPPPLACSVWVNASNQKKGSTSHPIWLCALRAFLTLGRAFWAAQCVPLASLSLAHLPARENSSARALPPQRHLPPRWPLASKRNSYGVGGSGCCWGQPRTTPPPQGRETPPDPPKPLEN